MANKTQTLQDTFNNNAQDSSKWSLQGPGTPANQIKFVNTELEITTDGTINDYFTCQSVNTYDLTGSYMFVQLVSAGAQAANQDCVPLIALSGGGANSLHISVNGATIACFKTVSNTQTQIGSGLPYNSATHKWFQIREAAGNIFYDYSTDGIIWTNITSTPDPIALTFLNLGIQGGQFGAAATTTFKYDNFNVSLADPDVLESFSVSNVAFTKTIQMEGY